MLDKLSGLNEEITISLEDKDEPGNGIEFLMLPEEILVETAAQFQSYNVMSVGEIKIPSGDNLTTFSWSGVFPGQKSSENSYVKKGNWQEPLEIQSKLSRYRVYKKKLNLMVSGTPINHEVYLDNYTFTYRGSLGDYYYSIKLVHAREIRLYTDSELVAGNKDAVNARPEPAPKQAHTVVKGESLWKIAEKHLGNGSRWPEIYELNKSAIGSDPNKIMIGATFNLPS